LYFFERKTSGDMGNTSSDAAGSDELSLSKTSAVAAIVKAVNSLDAKAVQFAISRPGVNIHGLGADGKTALFHALAKLREHLGNSEQKAEKARKIIGGMVERGAGAYEANGAVDGWPLHACAKMGDLAVVQKLLASQAGELLMLNADNETACQIARREQHNKLDQFL
jgi:hypothetical protein